MNGHSFKIIDITKREWQVKRKEEMPKVGKVEERRILDSRSWILPESAKGRQNMEWWKTAREKESPKQSRKHEACPPLIWRGTKTRKKRGLSKHPCSFSCFPVFVLS
jgi:hypothetical protein